MRKRSRIIASIFLVATIMLSGIYTTFRATPVSAATDSEAAKKIFKKALLNGLYSCYETKREKGIYLQTEIYRNDFDTNFNNIFTKTGEEDNILMPTIGGKSNDGHLSCKSIFSKLGGKPKDVTDPLKTLGYNEKISDDLEGEQKMCLAIEYSVASGGVSDSKEGKKTNQICFETYDGEIDPNTVEIKEDGDDDMGIFMGTYGVRIQANTKKLFGVDNAALFGTHTTEELFVPMDMKWSEFKKEIESRAKEINGFAVREMSDTSPNLKNLGLVYQGIKTNEVQEALYSLDPSQAHSGMSAVRYYSKKDKYEDIAYTDRNRFDLGMLYINKYLKNDTYGLSYDAGKCTSDKSKAKKDSPDKMVYHQKKNTWCPISGASTIKDIKVHMITGPHEIKNIPLTQVIEEMSKDKYNDFGQGSGNAVTGNDDDQEGGDSSEADGITNCFEGAGALGWILCPTLTGMSAVVSGIYDYIEDNFLAVDGATLMKNNGSLHKAWGTFRDYANILFVILLAIVILSQLTGIGLNNYNIKKILPRLIVMVVLVNVSFIICQLAVDLSNIAGYGIRDFFENASEGITKENTTIGGFVGALKSGLATVGTAVTITVFATKVVFKNWEVIVPLLLIFLITAIIGIVFFAIVLAVRQAGIIILVALTPVAIVCYTLPNTKKIFDKWFKLFSALLLVFPICGALMGGGLWASKLLMSTGKDDTSFFFALVAMLLQVVPFFLVPSLVKGSLSVAGNLGTKISRVGSNLGSGAARTARNSEGFKDFQQRMGIHNAERQFKRLEAGKGFRNRIANSRRLGNTGLGRFAQTSVNNAKLRYSTAANKQARSDLAARAGSSLLSDDEKQNIYLNELASHEQEKITNDPVLATSIDKLESAYDDALTAAELDPQNLQARARAVALQNTLKSSYKGKGLAAVENIMGKHVAAHANEKDVGSVLTNVAQSYLQQNGDGKGINGALHAMMGDVAQGGGEVYKKGSFGVYKTLGADGQEKDNYYNTHYDGAAVVGDLSNDSIGKLNKASLKRTAEAISTGDVDDNTMAAYEGLIRSAFADPNVRIEQDNVKAMNGVLSAISSRRGASFIESTNSSLNVVDPNNNNNPTGTVLRSTGNGTFTDGTNTYRYNSRTGGLTNVDTGAPDDKKEIERAKLSMQSQAYVTKSGQILNKARGNRYTTQVDDGTGNKKTETYELKSDGSFAQVGGAKRIAKTDVKKAQDVFNSSTQPGQQFRHEDVAKNKLQGETLKVPRREIEMPQGWMRYQNGTWMDTVAHRNLTMEEVQRAEDIQNRNRQIRLDNDEARANGEFNQP